MITVLGLDLSLKATGACVLIGHSLETPVIKTYLLSRDKVSGVEAAVKRLLSISDDIIDIIKKDNIMSVIIEAPAQNQKWQAAAIGELHGVVKADIYRKTGIIPMVEQATKLRKMVVGSVPSIRTTVKGKDGKDKKVADYGVIKGKRKGTVKKATIKDIIEHRLEELGFTFPSQDEMDAYVAARYAWDILSKN